MLKKPHARLFVILFALTSLIATTAANTADTDLLPGTGLLSDSEVAAEDAGSYATEYGVTLEVAKDRLSYQEGIGDAISSLRDGEPATFGGAWVEHSPKWQVVVRTTPSGPSAASIARYFSGVPIPMTVLRNAPWSEATALANMTVIAAALDNTVVHDYVLAFDPRRPKGVIAAVRVPAGYVDASKEQLDALLPALVSERVADWGWHDGPLFEDDADVYGGAVTLYDDNPSCTTGFSVRQGSTKGFVTAGHCKDDLDYESQDGDVYEAEFQDEVDGWRGDFQWHTTDETEVNKIYRTSTGRLRTITSYEDDYGDLYIGQRVCMYGRVTHNHCSEIYGLSVGAPFERGRIAMKTREARGGDSGGPWYYRKTAYGVHEGWTWLFGSRDKWTAVAWLDDALDVTVLTS